MKVINIIFSPTGGTKKVADIVANTLSTNVTTVDLSERNFDFSSIKIQPDDLCILAVPAYGGRVPSPAVENLSKINGNCAKTVLIAAYGNREFDDTLVELEDAAKAAGFIPMAGIGAVTEHSLARKYGAGRPDDEDKKELKSFAEKISAAIHTTAFSSMTFPGNRPYKEYNGVPAKPMAGKKCISCGLCATKCPVGAIPENNPKQTNNDICISCMKCTVICPKNARKLKPIIALGVSFKLSSVCKGRKKNTLYL